MSACCLATALMCGSYCPSQGRLVVLEPQWPTRPVWPSLACKLPLRPHQQRMLQHHLTTMRISRKLPVDSERWFAVFAISASESRNAGSPCFEGEACDTRSASAGCFLRACVLRSGIGERRSARSSTTERQLPNPKMPKSNPSPRWSHSPVVHLRRVCTASCLH